MRPDARMIYLGFEFSTTGFIIGLLKLAFENDLKGMAFYALIYGIAILLTKIALYQH